MGYGSDQLKRDSNLSSLSKEDSTEENADLLVLANIGYLTPVIGLESTTGSLLTNLDRVQRHKPRIDRSQEKGRDRDSDAPDQVGNGYLPRMTAQIRGMGKGLSTLEPLVADGQSGFSWSIRL